MASGADGLTWNHRLSVGVAMIDDQHRKLIELTRALFVAHDAKSDSATAQATFAAAIDGLTAYAATHFADEEELLAAGRCATLARHKAEHRALTDEVLALKSQAEGGDLAGAAKAAARWLAERLIPHIAGPDPDAFGACTRPLGPQTHIARTTINGEAFRHVVFDDQP